MSEQVDASNDAREVLYLQFKAYRLCKALLSREIVPHAQPVQARKGYANAIDPDLIRVMRVFPTGPSGFNGSMYSHEDRRWVEFVEQVDRRVQRLPAYQRSLIEKRFLVPEPLPTDYDVYQALCQEKGYKSWRSFERQKNFALDRLAKSLKIRTGAGS